MAKIIIATTRRFHLVDLARELQLLGEDVELYTIVPKKRIRKFGVKEEKIHSLFWMMLPFIFLEKIFKGNPYVHYVFFIVLDFIVSLHIKKCDLFIGLGTAYFRCFIIARKRNIPSILEWGSKHINVQQAILKSIGAPLNKEFFNRRSRTIYEIADYIAVPAQHVVDSFISEGVPLSKLLLNPYGVLLNDFPPTSFNQHDNYDLIFVGRWSLRKGCDILADFCESNPEYRVLHVGGIEQGLRIPNIPNLHHHSAVDEKELKNQYSKARALILLSREEGLSLVQCQALACGLPIVCTRDTGGADLKKYLEDPQFVIVLKDTKISTIKECVDNALELSSKQTSPRLLSSNLKNSLSWECYAKRYIANLKKIGYGS